MTMRSTFFALAALLAAGCGASSSDISAVTSLTGDAAAGKTVYSSNCQVCHGADGVSGSAHRDTPATAKSNPDDAVGTILTGDGEMPSFQGKLSNQDIANVVAYLKTL